MDFERFQLVLLQSPSIRHIRALCPKSPHRPSHTIPTFIPRLHSNQSFIMAEQHVTVAEIPHRAIIMAECKICHEVDDASKLESPCACSGSLKYAHRKCVQRWCDEKGNTTCEICHKSYEHGYASASLQLQPGSVTIDFSDDRDPLILTPAAAEIHVLESELVDAHFGSAACCRLIMLILLSILLLRHIIAMMGSTIDSDAVVFVTISLLRVAGFLLPCYIVARAMNMLEARQHEFQVATMTSPEVQFLFRARHPQGIVAASEQPQ